ncbi:MAG TPA: MASE1 domain-containing protein [Candidatus Paceibacterota bacterium]|nr:MASE1 domain-containing protein [Candidatus Paceibacterota bacterium]
MSQTVRAYALFALQFLVVFGVYFYTARWGLNLSAINDFAALVWPATGIAIAAVYVLGYRIAPAIALAAFAVNYLIGAPILAATAIGIGNSLEAAIGVWLLRSFGFNPLFSRLVDSFVFIAVAISATVISATIGTTTLGLTALLSAADVPVTWLAWWVGDTISALILTPFLIRWLATPITRSRRTVAQLLEGLAFFTALIALTLLVFWDPIPGLHEIMHPYMVFVPLTWGALRVGPRAMTLAIATVAALATFGTLAGTGPFAFIDGGRELFLFALFLSTVAFIFLLFVTAVEERKNASKRLEENIVSLQEDVEEISAADQAKNEFIATLSHELRNPLAPILSSLEIIRMGRLQERDARPLIETTYENVMRMTRLLDDLLDVARISRKQFTLQMKTASLKSIVQHATAMAQPLMQKHGHSFSSALPRDDIQLHADQLRIEQVIVNLLNNAAKYTPPGGTISLAAHASRDGAEIRVRDNGIGISKHLLEKIFEPFKRFGNGQRVAESAGLGIGLSLAKRLVELHGGRIEARSDGPGKGSEFVVWLPVADAPLLLPTASESQDVRTPAEPSRKKERKRVLIVDDNKDAAEGIARLLNHSGHEAHVALDGAHALATLANFRPDVIFLDIQLPGESGYDLLRTIRNYLDPAPYFVALTGFGQEEDKEKAREAGFDGFLTKPVSIADLEKVLSHS